MTRGLQAGPSKSPSQAPGWVVQAPDRAVSFPGSRVGVGRGMRVFRDAPPKSEFPGRHADVRGNRTGPEANPSSGVAACRFASMLRCDRYAGRLELRARFLRISQTPPDLRGHCLNEGLRPPFRTWAIQVRSVVCLKSVQIGHHQSLSQGICKGIYGSNLCSNRGNRCQDYAFLLDGQARQKLSSNRHLIPWRGLIHRSIVGNRGALELAQSRHAESPCLARTEDHILVPTNHGESLANRPMNELPEAFHFVPPPRSGIPHDRSGRQGLGAVEEPFNADYVNFGFGLELQ